MQRHWNDRALYETLRDFSSPYRAAAACAWSTLDSVTVPQPFGRAPRGRPAPRLCRGEPSAVRVPAPPVGAPRLRRIVLVLLHVLGSKMVNEGSVC